MRATNKMGQFGWIVNANFKIFAARQQNSSHFTTVSKNSSCVPTTNKVLQ
jgi:hypothetical protein